MRRDESRLNEAVAEAVDLDRRTVNRAMAWSVPVIVGSFAAPAVSGSATPQAPVVTFGGGSGRRGGTSNARYVDFSLTFTSDQATTITLVSLTPDNSWTAFSNETWPNRVVSLAAGSNTVTFRLNRTGNATEVYTLAFAVPGTSNLGQATFNVA